MTYFFKTPLAVWENNFEVVPETRIANFLEGTGIDLNITQNGIDQYQADIIISVQARSPELITVTGHGLGTGAFNQPVPIMYDVATMQYVVASTNDPSVEALAGFAISGIDSNQVLWWPVSWSTSIGEQEFLSGGFTPDTIYWLQDNGSVGTTPGTFLIRLWRANAATLLDFHEDTTIIVGGGGVVPRTPEQITITGHGIPVGVLNEPVPIMYEVAGGGYKTASSNDPSVETLAGFAIESLNANEILWWPQSWSTSIGEQEFPSSSFNPDDVYWLQDNGTVGTSVGTFAVRLWRAHFNDATFIEFHGDLLLDGGGGVATPWEAQDEGTPVVSDVRFANFTGDGITVTQTGPNSIEVNVGSIPAGQDAHWLNADLTNDGSTPTIAPDANRSHNLNFRDMFWDNGTYFGYRLGASSGDWNATRINFDNDPGGTGIYWEYFTDNSLGWPGVDTLQYLQMDDAASVLFKRDGPWPGGPYTETQLELQGNNTSLRRITHDGVVSTQNWMQFSEYPAKTIEASATPALFLQPQNVHDAALHPSEIGQVLKLRSDASGQYGTTRGLTGATQANPVTISVANNPAVYNNGDRVRIKNVVGMTEINDREFEVTNATTIGFDLLGEDGTLHTAYVSDGWIELISGAGTRAEDGRVEYDWGSVIVEDEGTEITKEAKRFNFIGGNVTVTEPVPGSGDVQVSMTAIAGPSNSVLVYNSANIALTNAGANVLDFDSEDHDDNAWHDNGVNPSRLTVPAGVSKIRLSFNLFLQGALSGHAQVQIIKNGVGTGTARGLPLVAVDLPAGSTADPILHGTSAVINVAPGDYFELRVDIEAASETLLASLNTYFSAEEIS